MQKKDDEAADKKEVIAKQKEAELAGKVKEAKQKKRAAAEKAKKEVDEQNMKKELKAKVAAPHVPYDLTHSCSSETSPLSPKGCAKRTRGQGRGQREKGRRNSLEGEKHEGAEHEEGVINEEGSRTR